LLLSTLRSYVEAMGGTLKLVAEFPNRNPVSITGLDTLTPRKAQAPRRRKASRKSAAG